MVLVDRLLSGAKEHRLKYARPMVTLSYAQSLDGCIAARRGSQQVLSGPQAMEMTHRLRARHAAILVGVGTVLADDPRLNVRLVDGPDPQPIILDSRLRFPIQSRVLRSSDHAAWIVTTQHALEERQTELEAAGARVIRLEEANGQVDLQKLMEYLNQAEIDSLMVEGGARVITSFLRESLVDQVVLTISPLFIGGLHALESTPQEDFLQKGKGHFPRLKEPVSHQLGNDLTVWGKMDWDPG